MTVGVETEIKGNITKSESKRNNEEMEDVQAELAKIEKDTNESKALELFSSNGMEVRAKTEADESILSSETENPRAEMESIPKAGDASSELELSVESNNPNNADSKTIMNKKKKEKKKEKKKRNKAIEMTAFADKAPKMKGGFKQVEVKRSPMSCHLSNGTANNLPFVSQELMEEEKGQCLNARHAHQKKYDSVKGLKNLDKTCFMNVVLQCLIHCKPLMEKITSTHYPALCSCKSGDLCYECGLIALLAKSVSSKEDVISPLNFANDIPNLIHPNKRELVWQLKCCRCGEERNSASPFNHLGIDVSTRASLSEALKSFTAGGVVEGFKFDACRCSSRVEKTELLLHLPEVLVIQFQRCRYDYASRSAWKVDHQVEYPAELDLAPYMACRTDQRTVYELSAVVEHHGGCGNFGHYVSIIRHDSEWYICNDAEVTQVAQEEALKSSAYLLMYTKKNY